MTNTRITYWITGLIITSLSLTGCDSELSYDREVRPGQIFLSAASWTEDAEVTINTFRVSGEEYEGHTIHQGPVTVSAGVPFTVKTVTFSDGCWESAAPSTVTVEGHTATVEVFDELIWDYGAWCTSDLQYHPRTDRITFSTPGEAEVVIRGEYLDAFTPVATYEERFHPYELRFPVLVR